MTSPVAGDLEAAKADLLERAAEADPDGDGREELRRFLTAYYRHVDPEDLLGRSPGDVLAAATSHRALAAGRAPGTAQVRVGAAAAEAGAYGTVVEVVTDDMPFLVDSLVAAVNRAGYGIGLVIHPTWPAGAGTGGDAGRSAGTGQGESWIRLEIERRVDPAGRERLTADLTRVLQEVRVAVDDWPRMRAAAQRAADELVARATHLPIPPGEVAEAHDLLRWLTDGHFTFVGYREDRLAPGDGTDGPDGVDRLEVVPGTELGVLRVDPALSARLGTLPPESRPRRGALRPLIVTKAGARSTVHRPAYLDDIAVKTFDDEGRVTGERRFLGLFSRAAYTESVTRVPIVRRTVAEVLRRSGLPTGSHSAKDMLEILETFPRDELFGVSVDELLPVVTAVLHLAERRRLRLFLRRDDYGRFVSCLVYFPRDRYTTAVRLRMERILREAFRASSVDYTARVSESVLARLHFVVRTELPSGVPAADPAELEARLAAAIRSWDDELAHAARAELGDEEASQLLAAYPDAFPEAYKEHVAPRAAVVDLVRTAGLDTGDDPDAVVFSLYEPSLFGPTGVGLGDRRFKIYCAGPLSLSDVMPVLARLGVEVLDERPYEIERADGKLTYIYDFGLRHDPDLARGRNDLTGRFCAAFAAIWSGAAQRDGFNRLVLRADLDWRQVALLRAYVRYLRQAGSTYSQGYVERCLVGNVAVVRMLVRLFEARFDPDAQSRSRSEPRPGASPGRGAVDEETLAATIEAAIDRVESLDADRILRSLLAAIRATTRTNYFQPGEDGRPKDYLSIKLDPRRLPGLPEPRPWSEIWVHSPRVEGVHLRFGPVARGGLRWSDRPEDFRTEILGLVKAQTVKNAVIVPVGAKGGFFPKRLPGPAAGREARQAEAVACYRTLIRGMLDLTDNLVRGTVVPPPRVVRHDGDDPYLVVAADKGTATFSDLANEVAAEYGFWLGDAFASGGSAGYDHKAMGITARGAWESVKRHFRELGVDPGHDDITVAGIGDMSGDVFGNGMLLSEHIRLVAAFDHRHVFLDPDPDPAVSLAERRRLFGLPTSSWADYDASLISEGGGVYPRTAKSISVSPAARERLGLGPDEAAVTPARLISAILAAPVDLLWNGGIGTYVKASSERNADVGDRANDPVRIDAADLRCRVVGEGGNLGLTQLARIEAAMAGVHVNTDAIDNSAGVDCSDHEVNIKILLGQVEAAGELDRGQRDALLAEMTDEVADKVLADNVEQNVVLGIARDQAAATVATQRRLIRDLERRGQLDRALDGLPSDREIGRRLAAGTGLTSPEYAVLLAHAKIDLTHRILDSPLPDEAWFARTLRDYFPAELRRRFGKHLADHPLRREIIATQVVNGMVNRAGTSCVFRAEEETGARASDIALAYTVAYEVFDLERFWRAISDLGPAVAAPVATRLWLTARSLIDQTIRWLPQNRRFPLDVAAECERLGKDVEWLTPRIPDLLGGEEARRFAERRAALEADGVPAELAVTATGLPHGYSLLDISEITRRTGDDLDTVAALYFALSERFSAGRTLGWINALPAGDRWSLLARSSLRYDLFSALAGLTRDVLASTDGGAPDGRIETWAAARTGGVARVDRTLDDIASGEVFDLAALSVALRSLRTLIRT